MPYKDKKRAELNYYKNREKRIKYQREYDKKNKERKKLQDQKRYGTKSYNLKQKIRHHSQKNHLPILLEKYKITIGIVLIATSIKYQWLFRK